MSPIRTTTHLVSYRIVDRRYSAWSRYLLFLLACLLALVVVSNIIVPTMACAQPFGGTVVLGFGQRYGADDTNHLGVDVALDVGATLYAPCAGTVSYRGVVPAAAPAGQSVTALTITTELGHQVTLNPFATTTVKKGAAIAKGQALGTLSDTGDPSSPASHVHLSLRVDGIYRDPSSLIAATLDPVAVASLQPPVAPPPPATPPVKPVSPAPQPVSSPQPTPAPGDAPTAAHAPYSATQPAAEGVGAHLIIPAAPKPSPTPHPTPPVPNPSSAYSTLTPTVREPQTPSVIARIPGVAAPPGELSAALSLPTPSPTAAVWYRSLTSAQWAILLYAVGVVVPILGIGVRRLGRIIGAIDQTIGIPLFAAREEK